MSRPLTTGMIVSLALVFLTSPGWAKKVAKPRKARAVRAMVLPLKVRGLDAQQARSLGKRVGAAVVTELKDLGIFKLLIGKQVSAKLKRLKQKRVMVKDCDTKRKCVRAVGRNLGAKVLFHIQLAKAQEGITVTIRTLDVRSGKEVRKEVQFTTGEPADVDRAARWAARKVSSPMISTLLKGKGHLEIQASEQGADLYLNGKNFGKRTGKSFKVGSGVFDIQVKKEGFKPFHDVVVIRPGKHVVVKAELESERPAAVAVAPAPVQPEGTVPGPPDEGSTPNEPEPKKDLPAWAIFEKPKPAGESGQAAPGKTEPGKVESPKVAGLSSPGEKPKPKAKPEPFLPPDKGPLDEPVEKIDDEGSDWYASWWFWTIVGVAVAGGVGGGLYAGGVFDTSSGSGPTGAAMISWQ